MLGALNECKSKGQVDSSCSLVVARSPDRATKVDRRSPRPRPSAQAGGMVTRLCHSRGKIWHWTSDLLSRLTLLPDGVNFILNLSLL